VIISGRFIENPVFLEYSLKLPLTTKGAIAIQE